jgi:hypothetical protein
LNSLAPKFAPEKQKCKSYGWGASGEFQEKAVLVSFVSAGSANGLCYDRRGEIKPRVAERVALGAVADAHTRIERGGLEGKIVLIPNG